MTPRDHVHPATFGTVGAADRSPGVAPTRTSEPPTPTAASEPSTPAIFGICVTYRPDIPEFREVLRSSVRQLEHVVVVDNTPEPVGRAAIREEIERISEHREAQDAKPPVTLIEIGENVGLSRAYNLGIRKASEMGASLVLLLDQDSRLTDGATEVLRRAAREHGTVLPWGAFSGFNEERVEVDFPFYPVLLRIYQACSKNVEARRTTFARPGIREVLTFINSGTLIPMDALARVGGFNERLFLDCVDTDLSLRLVSHGYHLFAVDQARIDHRLGEAHRGRFMGRDVALRIYSPERTYHIVRDNLEFMREWYATFSGLILCTLLPVVFGTVGNVILLPDRTHRARAIFRALSDFGHSKPGSGR